VREIWSNGWKLGSCLTWFAERAAVAEQLFCGACSAELPRKGLAHRDRDIISFWSMNCPDCRTPHIIFNYANTRSTQPEERREAAAEHDSSGTAVQVGKPVQADAGTDAGNGDPLLPGLD
jgi:hypothetical protein